MDSDDEMDPYSGQLADLYDELKAADDLSRLAELIDGVVDPTRAGQRLLDLGCGTGSSTKALADRGYDVTGVDRSSRMLDVARIKYPKIQFIEADVRELPLSLTGFDHVNYTGDIPNHLLDPVDFTRSLGCAAKALKAGGVVTFDVNTLQTYRRLFGSTHAIERGQTHFTWIGRSKNPKADCTAKLDLVAFQRVGDHWKRSDVTMKQRHYSEKTILKCVEHADLELVEVYGLSDGQLTISRSEGDHVKLIYLARKPSP